MNALALGFGLGFVVALQIGPMSLWLVRSTLGAGLPVGLAIGAGIAVVDAGYSAAGAAGAAPLLTIGPLETILGLLGATVMAVLGARALATAFGPAVVAAAGAAGAADVPLLVSGVGLGSLAWVSLLATGTAAAGRAVGPRAIRAADLLAGAGMLVFAAVLAVHAL